MKTITTCALALLLLTANAFAGDKEGVTISFNSDDARTHVAPRHTPHDARAAVTTKHGAAMLFVTNDSVAVQLSDATMTKMKSKDDAGFLEELLVSSIKLAAGKSVEYPIAHIKSAEVRDGVLMLTNDEGKPVFNDIKVNGENVTHDLSAADAAKFVNAFRAAKARNTTVVH